MTDETRCTQEQFNQAIERVFNALVDTETRAHEAELSLDVLAFAAAVVLDINPSVRASSQVRKAAQQHGTVVLTFLQWMRKHYEEKGVRFGEAIGGETHPTGWLRTRNSKHRRSRYERQCTPEASRRHPAGHV